MGELLPGANPAREVPGPGTALSSVGLWSSVESSFRSDSGYHREERARGAKEMRGDARAYFGPRGSIFSILSSAVGLGFGPESKVPQESKQGECYMSNSQRALPMR